MRVLSTQNANLPPSHMRRVETTVDLRTDVIQHFTLPSGILTSVSLIVWVKLLTSMQVPLKHLNNRTNPLNVFISPLSFLASPLTSPSPFPMPIAAFTHSTAVPLRRSRSSFCALKQSTTFISRSNGFVRHISTKTTCTPQMIAGADTPSPQPSSTAANALIKFTRPHTIRGTILGAVAGCARALLESAEAIDWALLPRAALGMLALLLGNAFIVGINQIYDVRVDKINKPFLPLAAGEMSPKVAWAVVISSALAGLAIVRLCFSRLIFGLYSFGMVFGALYSVPPFRFKRYPALAAVTISCVRGFLMNFGVYHATKAALGIPFAWSPPITFLAVFMTIFACVIALSKDLPDIRGDRAEGVPTFASRVGPRRLIKIVLWLLTINYAGAIATAIFAPPDAFRRVVLGLGHLALGGWLLHYQRRIDPNSQDSIKDFYRFIWKLFYAEYLLFPFI